MPLFIVDAFADRPFAGNPAAVCPLDTPRPDDWLQAVAMEMNLSETAFPWPEGDDWRLRWFTPEVEVDLCGHATLATAHALWEAGLAPAGRPIRFHTRSGLLTATPLDGGWVAMDFPALPVRPCEPPPGLIEALGATPAFVGTSPKDLLCEFADEAAVRALRPDFGRLGRIPTRGVIVTARPAAAGAFEFVSRFFAPALGVPEDPVCGSAHCALCPYWAAKLGREDLVGFQASRRGGVVRVGLRGDRVRLSGRAVTVMRGELRA
jgi:predicted PhzF superfamily epimerase YddE/YHI9